MWSGKQMGGRGSTDDSPKERWWRWSIWVCVSGKTSSRDCEAKGSVAMSLFGGRSVRLDDFPGSTCEEANDTWGCKMVGIWCDI